MLRVEVVHSFDTPTARLLAKLVRVLTRHPSNMESIMSGNTAKIAALTALTLQLIADAKDNKDAFAAWRDADETRATKLQATIDGLKASQESGVDIPQNLIDDLTSVHSTLTGTNGDAVRAAALLNAPPTVVAPADATAAASAAPAPSAATDGTAADSTTSNTGGGQAPGTDGNTGG